MAYRIAGIDVHRRMLAVVIADVATEGEYRLKRRQVGANPSEILKLADGWWLRRSKKWSWIDRAVLASRVGDTGTDLDPETPDAGGRRPDVG